MADGGLSGLRGSTDRQEKYGKIKDTQGISVRFLSSQVNMPDIKEHSLYSDFRLLEGILETAMPNSF